MAKAVCNGQTLAESEKIETVEGNVSFPDESVKREFLRPSSTTSSCPWKGQARYYTILVDGQENPDAAWYYPDPKPAARNVKHHIAFWRGVEIIKEWIIKVNGGGGGFGCPPFRCYDRRAAWGRRTPQQSA